MSDLATLSYHVHRDTACEINRYFGFYRQEKAALAKVFLGTSLTDLVHTAGGTIEGVAEPISWYLLYHTNTLYARIDNTDVEITLGARKRRKATLGLPISGIHSEVAVCIIPMNLDFMKSELAHTIKEYLTIYQPI